MFINPKNTKKCNNLMCDFSSFWKTKNIYNIVWYLVYPNKRTDCTSHNALLPVGYFVNQLTMRVVSDKMQDWDGFWSSLTTHMTTYPEYSIGSNALWEVHSILELFIPTAQIINLVNSFWTVERFQIVGSVQEHRKCIWPLNMYLLSNIKEDLNKLVTYMFQGHNLISRNP